jgi:hemerythrin superfamily protein
MREDHHTIQELLYELLMQAKEGEISSTLPARLEGLLLQHNQAEENVLYEAVESMLAPESRTELLQTLMEEGELDIEEWIEGVSIIEGQSEDESDSDEEVSDSDCSNPVSLH